LEKLDPLSIAPNGILMLDREKQLHESHRHHSHLMALYPLHLINYDTDEHKRIYYNSLLQLDRLGTGNWAGFSFGWAAQLQAMALNGNAAYEKLRAFAIGFVADNGFHLNGDFKNYGFSRYKRRPFTLESLYAYCDAVQEILLQNHQGYLHGFPALPNDWRRKISFRHLRAYGGVLVSAEQKDGNLKRLILESGHTQTVRIKNTFATTDLVICANGKETLVSVARGEMIEVYHDGAVTEIIASNNA
jgi:alpha-L-fucosidase 2